jgi:hypothetical protein
MIGNTIYLNVDGTVYSSVTGDSSQITSINNNVLYIGNTFYSDATQYQLTEPISKVGIVNKKDILTGINISNYIFNPSFKSNLNGYASVPANASASISYDYSYVGNTSYKWVRNSSSVSDTAILAISGAGAGYLIPTTGSYAISSYFFIPPSASTLHGKVVSLSASGGSGYTVGTQASATLSRGQWVRANTIINFTGAASANLPVISAKLSTSASTDANEIIYIDSVKLESSSVVTGYYDGNVSSLNPIVYPISSNFSAEQFLEWNKSIPLDQSSSIVASKIYYNADNRNIQVYTSVDGIEWRKLIKNGDKIPSLRNNAIPVPIFLKIKMITGDSDSSKNTAPYLEVSTYNDISANGNNITLRIPTSYSNNDYSYQLRSNDYGILARSENFGVRFQRPNRLSELPGYASIDTVSMGSIEFFFRIDDVYNSASDNNIIDVGSVANTKIYYKPSDSKLYFDSGYSAVYVNGISVSSGDLTVTLSEIYHIVAVYNSVQSSKTVSLNYNSSQVSSIATYGYFKVYPQQLTASEAAQKYFYMIGINGIAINDKTNTATVYDSVAVYKTKDR